MKPTLLVLAAGMGSRYGGLKQLDAFGPSGETIMDYSVYDAMKAGFGKVVFIIRQDFADEFKEKITSKYEGKIPVEVVFQSLDLLPEGYSINPERSKPLGTAHAVWCARNVLDAPFAVINADDFYGAGSFKIMADYLSQMDNDSTARQVMVGYMVKNTLSENGSVSRGVCGLNEDGTLGTIIERTKIYTREDGKIVFEEDGVETELAPEAAVSMNMMGFSSSTLKYFDSDLKAFLDVNAGELKKEFFLPLVLNNLIQSGISCVDVLTTPEQWYGVTYPEDKPSVIESLNKKIEDGIYPTTLWK
ncbi:MAG: nucleotide-diphospho-sugar transferase [Flavobacteriales bacterium]|nr:nucleotide-diphospho-sugar transferase [Flavobacteriales bacterium]